MEDAEDLQAQQTAVMQLIKMRGTDVLKTPSLAKSIMADLTRNKQKGAVPAFYTMLDEMNSGKSFSDEKAAKKFLSMIEKACRENGLGIPHEIVVAKEKIKVIVPEDDITQSTETQENTAEPQTENKAEPKTTQPQTTPQVAKKSNAGVICIVVIAVVFLGYMFVIKPQQEAKRIAEMQRLEAQRMEETKQKVASFLREFATEYQEPEVNKLADAVIRAGVNAKDNYGVTALMCAAYDNNIDIAKLLIQSGADINAKDNNGYTELMYAASNNSYDVAQLIINAGADVNAKKNDGIAAIIIAAVNNSQDVVRLLINVKADINARDNTDAVALMYAAAYNNIDIAKLLIQAGADVNAKSNGETALDVAEALEYTQMAQLLRNAGATR